DVRQADRRAPNLALGLSVVRAHQVDRTAQDNARRRASRPPDVTADHPADHAIAREGFEDVTADGVQGTNSNDDQARGGRRHDGDQERQQRGERLAGPDRSVPHVDARSGVEDARRLLVRRVLEQGRDVLAETGAHPVVPESGWRSMTSPRISCVASSLPMSSPVRCSNSSRAARRLSWNSTRKSRAPWTSSPLVRSAASSLNRPSRHVPIARYALATSGSGGRSAVSRTVSPSLPSTSFDQRDHARTRRAWMSSSNSFLSCSLRALVSTATALVSCRVLLVRAEGSQPLSWAIRVTVALPMLCRSAIWLRPYFPDLRSSSTARSISCLSGRGGGGVGIGRLRFLQRGSAAGSTIRFRRDLVEVVPRARASLVTRDPTFRSPSPDCALWPSRPSCSFFGRDQHGFQGCPPGRQRIRREGPRTTTSTSSNTA